MLDPKKIARLVQIAMAVEPIPDKEGLTTRHQDITHTLKLEYFIVGAINSGAAVEKLITRNNNDLSYDLLFESTLKNQLNRGGMRVNAGQLQFLWPLLLVIRQYPEESDANWIFNKTREIMMYTSREDSLWLQATTNFSYSLWGGHSDRVHLINLECDSVYEAYEIMYKASDTNSNQAHCGEFLKGYPTTRELYNNFDQEEIYEHSMEGIYKWALNNIEGIPRGQLADCLACVTFLAMYLDGYKIK